MPRNDGPQPAEDETEPQATVGNTLHDFTCHPLASTRLSGDPGCGPAQLADYGPCLLRRFCPLRRTAACRHQPDTNKEPGSKLRGIVTAAIVWGSGSKSPITTPEAAGNGGMIAATDAAGKGRDRLRTMPGREEETHAMHG